jgi:hypothetical protein
VVPPVVVVGELLVTYLMPDQTRLSQISLIRLYRRQLCYVKLRISEPTIYNFSEHKPLSKNMVEKMQGSEELKMFV